MKFQVSEGEKFKKILETEISAEEMEEPIRFACKKLAEKVNIPGFRKGKAPRSILENYVGINAILDEAANYIMPKAYIQGLNETGLEPVSQPEVEITKLAVNEPMCFKATITVKPEIQLGQYKELPITRSIVETSDQDVDEEIEKQRTRMTKLVDAPKDAIAALGDTVVIDFKGIKNDEAFEGGTAENYPLELGSNNFIPGFEDQLVGSQIGDEKKVEITFPKDYPSEKLAGEPVIFEVKIKEIKNKVIPDLDQKFVEEVSETAQNLDQLKEEMKTKLKEEGLKAANNNARYQVLLQALEKVEVEIPPVMIDEQLDLLMEDNKRQMASHNITLEQYLEHSGITEEQMKNDLRKQAELMVKKELFLEAIIKAENIEVSEEEIANQIKDLAQKYWMTEDQMKEKLASNHQMEDFKYDMKRKKANDLIYNNAIITDEYLNRKDLEEKKKQPTNTEKPQKSTVKSKKKDKK